MYPGAHWVSFVTTTSFPCPRTCFSIVCLIMLYNCLLSSQLTKTQAAKCQVETNSCSFPPSTFRKDKQNHGACTSEGNTLLRCSSPSVLLGIDSKVADPAVDKAPLGLPQITGDSASKSWEGLSVCIHHYIQDAAPKRCN